MASTTTPTVPRSLLDAVNMLLREVRLSHVNSLLTADMNEDAAEAKIALDNASIEFQSEGWEFNTERGAIFDPSDTGEIILPANCLKVRSARCRDSGDMLVPRGNRLYNPKADKRTYTIGESVELDMVVALEFSELSSSGRMYVAAVAARNWCPTKLPDGATFRITEEVLEKARNGVEREDSELASEKSLKETSPHFAWMGRR